MIWPKNATTNGIPVKRKNVNNTRVATFNDFIHVDGDVNTSFSTDKDIVELYRSIW